MQNNMSTFKECLLLIESSNMAIQNLYEFRLEMAKTTSPTKCTWEKLGFTDNLDYMNFSANPLQYTIQFKKDSDFDNSVITTTASKLIHTLAWNACYQEVSDQYKETRPLNPKPTKNEVLQSSLYKEFYNYYKKVIVLNFKEN